MISGKNDFILPFPRIGLVHCNITKLKRFSLQLFEANLKPSKHKKKHKLREIC